ncbi:MAG: HD domain-containing protein [Heliobacteriaceae bacterium]|jgi:HD-GYP domain-containing protein (c-di-GMP phosphodiesterase class II)|nr:HD domain-containing protein [Heliobacteriaceae bacterium]
MKEENNGVSLFAQSGYPVSDDPIEEIFALNLGDFLSEHLISQDLAQKISAGVKDKRKGLQNQLKELTSLYSLNNTLCVLSFNEEQAIYTSIAQSVKQMLDAKACDIYFEKKSELALAGSSDETHSIKSFKLNENSAPVEAFIKKETVITMDYIAIPMFNNVKSVGVIVIPNEQRIQKEYLTLVESVALLFAASMSLQSVIDEAKKLIEDESSTVGALQHIRAELTALIGDLCNYQQKFAEHLAFAVDAKGQYKVSHSTNTAELARKICRRLELNEKTTDLIYYAGLLQNIGKIALPEEIFAVNGKLSPEELKKIQEHSNTAVNLLMNINFMSEIVPYITYQSERFDGSGRPEGLSGNSIPFGSRIIAAADAFSALTSDRPHRKALPVKDALEILKSEISSKWDPVVIEALCSVTDL